MPRGRPRAGARGAPGNFLRGSKIIHFVIDLAETAVLWRSGLGVPALLSLLSLSLIRHEQAVDACWLALHAVDRNSR